MTTPLPPAASPRALHLALASRATLERCTRGVSRHILMAKSSPHPFTATPGGEASEINRPR